MKSSLQRAYCDWKHVLIRAWKEQAKDNISLAAAGVAFYGFLALVPLLGAIVLTYGIAADPQTVVGNMRSLTSVLPIDVAKLIGDQLMSIVQTSGSKKGIGLIIALVIALWGSRNASTSLITALNIAFEEEEKRSTICVNLLAFMMTASGVIIAVVAMTAMTALGSLQTLMPHLPDIIVAFGKILTYVALLSGAAAAAATLYRFAPSRHHATWQWITPGSVVSAGLWSLLTLGFSYYVAHFGNYTKAYGTLSTVVILMSWMYFSAYVLLSGAELNSEFDKLAACAEPAGPFVQSSPAPPDKDRWE